MKRHELIEPTVGSFKSVCGNNGEGSGTRLTGLRLSQMLHVAQHDNLENLGLRLP